MRSRSMWACTLGLGVLLASTPNADAVILINEMLADPPAVGGDANRDGTISSTQDEFVELVNTAGEAVSMAGWSLWDASRLRHTFGAEANIPERGFFVVFGGGSPQGFTAWAISSQRGLSLNNEGDDVRLFDAAGVLVDEVAYGPEGGMDTSLTRFPDGTGGFRKHSMVTSRAFSPGATVDGRATLPSSTIPEPSSMLLLGLGLCGACRRAATPRTICASREKTGRFSFHRRHRPMRFTEKEKRPHIRVGTGRAVSTLQSANL